MTTPIITKNRGSAPDARTQGGAMPDSQEQLQLLAAAMESLMLADSRAQALALFELHARRLAGADAAFLLGGAGAQASRQPLLSHLADWAAQHGETAVLADAAGDARIPPQMERPADIASALLVPLGKGAAPHVLAACWREPHQFQAGEIALLQVLAHATGAALERQQAAAKLRDSEARFDALSAASPALIWQADADGRLVYLNHGLEASVAAQPDWQALLHRDDIPAFAAALAKAARKRAPLEWRARGAHGERRWLDIHALPVVDADAGYAGHVGIAIDISDVLAAERALRQADRRKDEFLAMLAHELRNPLAPISNVMYLLRHEGGRRRSDRLLQIADRHVRHIVRLVDDLLQMSRITSGRIALRTAPLALADALTAAIETARPQIEGGRHRLKLALPPQPVLLEADMVRLTQVFANLLDNAARYTAPGGDIELAARLEQDAVEIAVRDNGAGIAPELHSRIFDLFTRGQRADGQGHGHGPGGLGVGLSMVKSLVELHHGSIEVHSAGPGKGSEFIVRLPLRQSETSIDGKGEGNANGPNCPNGR
jgi:PAS domain S-box-containing protein